MNKARILGHSYGEIEDIINILHVNKKRRFVNKLDKFHIYFNQYPNHWPYLVKLDRGTAPGVQLIRQ
jgi:hypothetical protein